MKKVSQSFLCACMKVSQEKDEALVKYIKAEYEMFDRDDLYEQLRKQKIVSYVAHALLYCDCDVDFWRPIHEALEVRNQKVFSLLCRIFERFDEEGMNNICVVENFASILSSDSCMGCFCSGDVDLFCYGIDMDKMNDVMADFGFVWSDRHKRKKSFAREYKSMDAIGEEFWLNFQWKAVTRKKTHLYDQRYIAKRYPKLFSETEYYKDTKIKIFKPEAALYTNCLHIACCHYYILTPGIRLYADVDRPIRNREIDWNKFLEWINEDKIGLRSDIVLYLSKIQLNTPIPMNAYTNRINNKRSQRFIDSLIYRDSLEYKRPKKGLLNYILFLIRVELNSDGTNAFWAFLKRIWVIMSDFN